MGKKILLVLLPLMVVLSYQACTSQVSFTPESTPPPEKSASQPPAPLTSPFLGNNGEGYNGKLTKYEYMDPQQPCVQKSPTGKTLPNAQIQSFDQGGTYLTRRECTDLNPLLIPNQELSVTATGDLNYAGLTFKDLGIPGDFDVLRATCPVGMLPKANAVRTNMTLASQNLLSASWLPHPGITANWQGSLAGLTLFGIQRSDPALLDRWRRMAQDPNFEALQQYVYSFFVEKNSSTGAYFLAYNGTSGDELGITFDLTTGAATYERFVGFPQFSTRAIQLENGLFISIYFTMTRGQPLNVGITPLATTFGAQISATAFQLEKVSDFCGP